MACRCGAEGYYAGKQRKHKDDRHDDTPQESQFGLRCAKEKHLHSQDEANLKNYIRV
jgi:hypothetical protein